MPYGINIKGDKGENNNDIGIKSIWVKPNTNRKICTNKLCYIYCSSLFLSHTKKKSFELGSTTSEYLYFRSATEHRGYPLLY